MLDGEVVIARDGRPRLRGAAAADPPGRVAGRACWPRRRPASFVAWDLLALGDEDLRAVPQGERRARLVEVLAGVVAAHPPHARHAGPRARRRLVRPVRGRGPRRRGREAPRRRVPARQARDAQDQARAHRRLRGRRLPLAQERARDARRQPAAGPVRRRGQAPPRGDHVARSPGSGAPRWSRSWRRSGRARSTGTRGPSGPSGRAPAPTGPASGSRAPARAGTAARTCPGSRCAASASPRSATTTSRATASATRPRSSAGARTRRPPTAATTSWRPPSPFELARIFGGG